jgi:outer membrane protein TolC
MISGNKHVFTVICLLCCSGTAVARNLVWNDVVNEAATANPALAKAKESLAQARWSLTRAYSNFLPQLSASASAGQSQSDTTGLSKDYSYGLSGSLSLFSGFADTSEIKSRSYDLRIAEANYARILADTLYSLRKSFFDLLWAQETVRLSQDILKRRNENLDMVQLKYESGSEDKGSLLRIDADRVQARYDLEKAQRAQQNASLALSQAMGRSDFAVITVTATLSPGQIPATFDLRQSVERTPEHVIAQYTLQKAAAGITAAESSLYPSLSLSAGTGRSGTQWGPDSGRWNAGLAVSYPFFPGGRNIYDIKIANSNKIVADQALRQTDEQAAVRLNGAYFGFIDAVGNVGVREKYLTASDTQSHIITAKYLNGLASYQDWYTIENDFINSQRALLNARHDAVLSEAQFQNALGAGD